MYTPVVYRRWSMYTLWYTVGGVYAGYASLDVYLPVYAGYASLGVYLPVHPGIYASLVGIPAVYTART